ncbi:MAG: glycosyltransferase family 39 protein [Terracidiphilus sp.]|jgi:predicted membrane-bound mannosyltransferase
MSTKRWIYAVWLAVIGAFAVLHALHLRADFPNHTIWFCDWAKYTDEGWYGNAAIRAHLFGNWYLPGDFNPAPAVPVWPFLEWVLFFFTGVTIQAARGLAVAFFFVNLLLSYLLLRSSGSRWMALLALTLIATSPFLYCFSRLAILEPMLTAFTLAALNLAVRLPRMRRPVWFSVWIGVIFTLMMLTKTTAVFLLPAVIWAMVLPLWKNRRLAIRCVLTAAGIFATTFGLWMALIVDDGLFRDYKYLFSINKYDKPPEFYWPFVSLWWSFHGGLWIDRILIPLAGIIALGAALAWRSKRARRLLLDPVFGASAWAAAGYILFMTVQNHPQPRYFAVVAFFSFFMLALGIEALLGRGAVAPPRPARMAGWAAVALTAVAVGLNAAQTARFAAHPEYTLVNAVAQLTQYIDAHPNGNRMLVSISGDEFTLVSHLPAMCDDFGTEHLDARLSAYQPGWYATWNDIDPGILESIHESYSMEQVATFQALDDPQRNLIVLFKLHQLPGGKFRDPSLQDLTEILPEDKIDIPLE